MSARSHMVVLFAAACAAALVAADPGGGAVARPSAVPGAAQVNALLRGIPQRGPWLGRATAPLILVEYVDLQCPYCARFSDEIFPTVVQRYVRTGRVRILFRGLAFVGPDSARGLRWATAAGRQNRLWNVVELLFANQGAENRGWVTPRLLNAVARDARALDVKRLRRDADGTWVSGQINATAAAAGKAHVPGTPYFEIGPTLQSLEPLKLRSLRAADFTADLDSRLR